MSEAAKSRRAPPNQTLSCPAKPKPAAPSHTKLAPDRKLLTPALASHSSTDLSPSWMNMCRFLPLDGGGLRVIWCSSTHDAQSRKNPSRPASPNPAVPGYTKLAPNRKLLAPWLTLMPMTCICSFADLSPCETDVSALFVRFCTSLAPTYPRYLEPCHNPIISFEHPWTIDEWRVRLNEVGKCILLPAHRFDLKREIGVQAGRRAAHEQHMIKGPVRRRGQP